MFHNLVKDSGVIIAEDNFCFNETEEYFLIQFSP